MKNDRVNDHCYSSPLSLSCLFVFPFNAFDLLSVDRLIPSISIALRPDGTAPLGSPDEVPGVDKPQLFLPQDGKTCSTYTVVSKQGWRNADCYKAKY